MGSRSSVLVLYDPAWTHIPTVREFLQGLQRFSRHCIHFSPAYIGDDSPTANQLAGYDAVVIHYSVRLTGHWRLTGLADRFRAFAGLRAAFLQDEYEETEAARCSLEDLGVELVFTCVPQGERERFYPAARFPHTRFIQVLTGYVPLDLERRKRLALPLAERQVEIGYRGRRLGYWYGTLAMEKWWIGRDVKTWCIEQDVRCDIDWSEPSRLYGDEWYAFLGRCVATLGCESGANIIDEDGEIRRRVETYLEHHPNADYVEVHASCLQSVDEVTRMNQVSPRIFEAVAMRTALVLYEGEYSNIVQPHVHYFPLKRDGSNFSDVIRFIRDPDAVRQMTGRAYKDLIASERYGYETLAIEFDAALSPLLRTSRVVEVRPACKLSAVASDGSPDRIILQADDPRTAVSAFRLGAPSTTVLAFNTEFFVPNDRPQEISLPIQQPTAGVAEARFRRRFVMEFGVEANRVAEARFYFEDKETARFNTESPTPRLLHGVLADRLVLTYHAAANLPSVTARMKVCLVKQALAMIPPEPWLTRALKAVWHLLPLSLRLSAPAMRAKAAFRGLVGRGQHLQQV